MSSEQPPASGWRFSSALATGEQRQKIRNFAKSAGESTSTTGTTNPVSPQAAGLSFEGIAKLAEALEKINPSGRFLVAAIAFAAAATLVVTAGVAKG